VSKFDKQPKKKKVDYEALQSSFMQVPMMKADIARGLMDIGVGQHYELTGRAPEALVDAMLVKHPDLKGIPDLRERVHLAVYFMENPEPEPHKLKLSYWSTVLG
jgi:hypothetical protein